jgi:hypothetical protein
MPKIYLALYKGRKSIRHPRDLWPRLSDGLVRLLTRSPYSHCEIAVQCSDGLFACYSSSPRDGGVRAKIMPLPAEKWDLIALPEMSPLYVRAWFEHTQGKAYDWGGLLGVPLGRWAIAFNDVQEYFCSEWCAQVMRMPESWRFSPGALAKLHAPVGAPK